MWLTVAVACIAVFAGLVLAGGLYLMVGPGPVRSRAFHAPAAPWSKETGRPPSPRLNRCEPPGCLRPDRTSSASSPGNAVRPRPTPPSRKSNTKRRSANSIQAASLLAAPEADARARVIDAALSEVRRQFAAGSDATDSVLHLLGRILAMQSPCPEARFWQGMCFFRRAEIEPALAALTSAYEQAGKSAIDPAFYLGAMLHRAGRSQEGLRYLGDANRIDAGCPFVTWQMGVSLMAAGGDPGLAVRALQRALGPRGLPLWSQAPQRAWVEAFPEGRSYVRRLATKNPYTCPVLGGDLNAVILEGQLALAQAQYRQGSFQEAADLFSKLLQNTAPTTVLLRGLGLSLARLGRYDQAYKHLRAALEQEQPKDPFTAAYLGLCGAMGKPTQPEDKPKNVAWAVRLLARYAQPGNAEYAGIMATVHAEARALEVPLPVEDQIQLCDALASVAAVDKTAAQTYHHLAASFPEAIKPIHAWLYVRAASVLDLRGERDLDLFALTFANAAPARAYFALRQWNFDDAEYTYLKRGAAVAPGRFPESLGPDYPPQGEAFLLARSRAEEEAGRKDAALECVEALLCLAPMSLPGHDRLACLLYRKGDMDRAAALLAGWRRLNPVDHWPLVRQAIIEQQRGNARGPRRGHRPGAGPDAGASARRRGIPRRPAGDPGRISTEKGRRRSEGKEHRRHAARPGGAGSRGQAAAGMPEPRPQSHRRPVVFGGSAVGVGRSGGPGVASGGDGSAGGERRAVPLSRRRLLAGGARLRQGGGVEPAGGGRRCVSYRREPLRHGVAQIHLNNGDAARQSLMKAASADKSPSAPYARALLGQQAFSQSAFDEAVRWWKEVDPSRRAEWKLDEPLRQTVLLAGLMAYEKGKFELAAERIREAGRLGLRDRRLGSMLTLALVKAGQRLLFDTNIKGVK